MKMTLKRKLLGLLAILYLALVASTIYSLNSVAKTYVVEDLESEMSALAEKTAEQIQDYFVARASDISFVTESRKRELFEEYILGKENPTQLGYLKKKGIESVIGNIKKFDSLAITDNAGLEVVKFHEGMEVLDISQYNDVSAENFFKKARELGGKVYVSDVAAELAYSETGETHILMSQAYYDEFGRFGGIVVGTLDSDSFSKFAGSVKLRKTGYAWIIDSSSSIIYHPDTEHPGAAGIFGESKAGDAKAVQVRDNMLLHKKGFDAFAFNGESYFIAYFPINGMDWSLAITVPESEGLIKLNQILITMLIQMTVVFAVLFATFAYFTGGMMRPINELTKASKSISEGNLDVILNVKSNDEIGVLASSFQKMATDLKKSQADIRNKNKELEEKVQEKTKELQGKVAEMERFNKLAVGRELKMIELKKRINELENK